MSGHDGSPAWGRGTRRPSAAELATLAAVVASGPCAAAEPVFGPLAAVLLLAAAASAAWSGGTKPRASGDG